MLESLSFALILSDYSPSTVAKTSASRQTSDIIRYLKVMKCYR